MSGGSVVPIVIDTNVLIPAIYMKKPIARFVITGHLKLIWSEFTFWEATRVASRLSIHYLIKTSVQAEDVIRALEYMASIGLRVPDMPETWPEVAIDRSDDNFLYAAVAGGAEFIISQDKSHLLPLGNFEGIPIGTPYDFFTWIKAAHPWPEEVGSQEDSKSLELQDGQVPHKEGQLGREEIPGDHLSEHEDVDYSTEEER